MTRIEDVLSQLKDLTGIRDIKKFWRKSYVIGNLIDLFYNIIRSYESYAQFFHTHCLLTPLVVTLKKDFVSYFNFMGLLL